MLGIKKMLPLVGVGEEGSSRNPSKKDLLIEVNEEG